ncbi:hypothetical protein LTS18_014621, partial [Coniosporium uncinatum]
MSDTNAGPSQPASVSYDTAALEQPEEQNGMLDDDSAAMLITDFQTKAMASHSQEAEPMYDAAEPVISPNAPSVLEPTGSYQPGA